LVPGGPPHGGLGWVDERGHEVAAPPESRRLTRAAAPGGGEVVLVHGQDATADSQLAQSAAAAAALSLEAARLDAEVRLHARYVDTSRRRLLTAVDDERRLLEQRLSESVLVRLRQVDRLLSGRPFEQERRELWVAVDELVALGRGLYPPSLARSDLTRALREIAARCRRADEPSLLKGVLRTRAARAARSRRPPRRRRGAPPRRCRGR
jgi:hypothetical protein